MDTGKDLPCLSNEICPLSPQDADQLMSVKVQEVQDKEVPVLITWPVIKAEHEVSL
jgi:hypothetical protein